MNNPSMLELMELTSITRLWGWGQLSSEEQGNIKWATSLVGRQIREDFTVDVVDFKHDVGGCFWRKHHDGRANLVRIARKHALDRLRLIIVMVHEVCHMYGRDYSAEHRNACEVTFGKIIMEQINAS